MTSKKPERHPEYVAKQFLTDHLNGLCQELYAWRCQQDLPPGGLLSKLVGLCNEYVAGGDEHGASREAEMLIEQAALLYGAGSQSSPKETQEQLRRGLYISMGPVPQTAR